MSDNCKILDKNQLGEPLPSRNQTVGDTLINYSSRSSVESNQDSTASGRRGPLLQDIWFGKLAHFEK